MREAGAVIDKVVVTPDAAYNPATVNGGLGPDESVRGNPTDADLAVTKSVDTPTALEGDTLVYTVTVTNNGPADATGVSLIDVLPEGLGYVSDNAAASGTFYDSATGEWTVGSLGATASATLQITTTVNPGTAGSTLTNTAIAGGLDQADPDGGNDMASADVAVVVPGSTADLAVTKSVDDSAPNEGDTLVYTVTVTNNGPANATGVSLSDVLPAGLSYVSDDAAASGTSYDSGTGVWSVNGLNNAAAATLHITATVNPGTGGDTLTNTASVVALDQTDPEAGNDSAAVAVNVSAPSGGGSGFQQDGTGLVSMEVEHFVASAAAPDGHEWLPAGGSYPGFSGSDALRALPADTALVKTGYATQSPRLDYEVNFAQTGTVYVWVRMLAPTSGSDSLHVGLDGVEVTSSRNIVAPSTGSYVWSSAQANGKRATMIVGTAGLHTVNVWMREAGAVIDKVVVTPDAAFNPAALNGGLGPDESVRGNPTDADLAVAKTVDKPTALSGDTLVYTVTVTNNGPAAATGVSLVDVLPAGLSYMGDDAAASGTFYDSATGAWTVGGLGATAAATLQITAQVTPGTAGSTLTNTASVTALDQPDPVPGNDSAAVDVTVVEPGTTADLAVGMSVDDANPSEGGTVVYTVTVLNNGLLDATGVSVTDVLPAGLTYLGDDAGLSGTSYDSASGLWSIGALANGQLTTLHVTATVESGTAGSTLTNTASLSGLDQVDPDAGNDSATVVVTVAAASGGGSGFQQDGTGLVSMEAEHYEASAVAPDGHEWLPAGGSYPGYSGSDALRALPADNVLVKTGYAALSPRLDYPVTFAQTGTVYVWVRMLAPSGSSDTVHVGLDGVEVDSSRNIVAPTTGSYVWSSTQASGSRATMVVGTTGLHTVNVWMREAGAVIDKVVVTPDAAYNPATVNGGLGPDETRPAGVTVEAPVISPAGGVFANPVAVSLSTASEGATIRYTLDGSVPTAASTQYTAPFQVLFDTTVKARAFLDGYNDSAVSTAVFQIQALVPPTGLSDYWKLDETAGSTYTSAVDGNPAATCTACPAPVAGRIDGAQQFDGATDEVSVADNGAFDWPNGARLSIEAWIKRGSPCSVTGETVIGRRDASSLLEWSLGCQGINAAFRLVDTTGAGAGSDLVGTSDIADGNWHHVVAVRDAISGKNVLYVDGVEEASTAVNYAGDFAGSTDIDIGWLGQAGSDRHFAGSIDEIAIHERVLPDSEIRRHYADGAVGLQRGVWGCGAPVRIMPLGDSITRRWNPGYREGLYIDLIGAGMDIDMVGSMTDNCAPDCAHDPNHEGHSGYTASNIAGNVGTWLNLNPADVIMLHIGTNVDAGFPYPDVTAVGGVLDAIKAYDPDIPVVLARIINKARSSYDPQLSVFNQNLESLAQARVAAGDRILVVDQEPDLDYSGTTVDFAVGDDLHPTASGYAKMVPVWFEGLNRFMPACESVVPQVISTAPTAASIAVPYAYVVEATGVPAPGFSLTAAPAGMTIHPDTGRIDWLPQSAGSYGVTVRVTNIVGSSTQSFTIVVN
jgi:uncharacterized repeat protein (TIGR01451 family)